MGWNRLRTSNLASEVTGQLARLEAALNERTAVLTDALVAANTRAESADTVAKSVKGVRPLNSTGAHVPGQVYEAFDYVLKGSSSYVALKQTATTPPSADWGPLAIAPTNSGILEGVRERVVEFKLSEAGELNAAASNHFIVTVDADRSLAALGLTNDYAHTLTVTFRFSRSFSYLPRLNNQVNWHPQAPVWPVGQDTDVQVAFWTRKGVLYGKVVDIDGNVPRVTPVDGGFLQLLLDEASGLPQDSSGNGNHATAFDGARTAKGGVSFAQSKHLHTGTLKNFNINASWWAFQVMPSMAQLPSGAFLSGFADPAKNGRYTRLQLGTSGDLYVVNRDDPNTDNLFPATRAVLSNPQWAYRTAFVNIYDANAGTFEQRFLNPEPDVRSSAAATTKLAYASGRSALSLGSLYRPASDALIGFSPSAHDYVFAKQGLPTDSEIAQTYAFAKALCARRDGAGLP